jgi:hypothetical protein
VRLAVTLVKPFTGTEAEPRYQHIDGLTEDERKLYHHEIDAARDWWALARFLHDAAAVITTIGADWQTYFLAEAAMDEPADRRDPFWVAVTS